MWGLWTPWHMDPGAAEVREPCVTSGAQLKGGFAAPLLLCRTSDGCLRCLSPQTGWMSTCLDSEQMEAWARVLGPGWKGLWRSGPPPRPRGRGQVC